MSERKTKKIKRIDSRLFNVWYTPAKITAIYLLLGALWILFSDKLVEQLVSDREVMIQISIYKGWAYVVLTGLLIFFFVLSAMRRLAQIDEQQKQLYADIKKSEERYRLAVEGANDGIWDWDIKEDTVDISPDWAEMVGLESSSFSGYREIWESRIHQEDVEMVMESLDKQLGDREISFYREEYRLKLSNDSYIWVYSRGKILRNTEGTAIRIAGSHTDITERISIMTRFENLAYYDELTGLYNKTMLTYLLNSEIEKSNVTKSKFALLLLGMDNFKRINDTYGRDFGDKFLIKTVSEFKESLDDKCIISRVGGSKFAILVTGVDSNALVLRYLQVLTKRFSNIWVIDEKHVQPMLSIGVAIFPENGHDAAELIRNSDMAMYKAKDDLGCSYRFYEDSFYSSMLKKIDMERRLRLAILNNELVLHFQPQFVKDERSLAGMEALVRWQDPEKGMISPAEFIPIAEESGLIIELGYWVLREACKYKRYFRTSFGQTIPISINVSVLQLRDHYFVERVKKILAEEDVSTENIILEITESVIINNFTENRAILDQLRTLGFRIALDDFGTGYSSLNYLSQIPIDEVKIDRVFVSNLPNDTYKMSLIDMIIELSHRLGLSVTAEGVEQQDELNYLNNRNCDKIQGYILSKPMKAEDVVAKYAKRG